MANKIMGITIDIEGKTSGLTKSLQDANTAISKTTSALKDVDKALQLDPTNVELMAQKQALLEKQIVQTSEKLDVMKQVADDANEALARGDISQEQYASLTAELSKTDSALSQLAEEARDNADAMEDVENGTAGAADEMDEVSDGADEASGHLDALKDVAIAVGAEMAAAFGACVEAIKEVGGAMIDATVSAGDYVDEVNTLSVKTGISAERLQEMNYVTGLIDVSVETMTGSMTKLEKSMSSANKTNEQYEEKMAALNEQLEAGKITQEEWVEKSEEIEASTVTAYDKLGISITDVNGNLREMRKSSGKSSTPSVTWKTAPSATFSPWNSLASLPRNSTRSLRLVLNGSTNWLRKRMTSAMSWIRRQWIPSRHLTIRWSA